ncbi:MAG TPA: glycoside hydrolase [Vicinamibacteria bacterium]|nr:glycoside hydrolase [Vicinamibacteria bacterium]
MSGFLVVVSTAAIARPLDPSAYQDLRYRLIGPFRASRTVGGTGVPSQPNVFYTGVNNGGVWKTDDYGRTWTPIFDSAPTGSVGDLAVSPSHPDVIYVGTGEGLHRPDLSVGDGIFKSIDGGSTWDHLGLHDVQQVGRIVVHPTNPDIVFVAGLGRPYGPNEERGVFRTTNGGGTWEKVLYVDPNTGASAVEIDPSEPRTIYAALYEHRMGPWENGSFSGPGTGLYKSIDGGSTWRRLERGLPKDDWGPLFVGVSPRNPARVYLTVSARGGGGLYRSDDGGETWTQMSTDPRLGGDVRVHPDNPDLVFVGTIAAYRSEDGGRTWTSIKGAPGGDDYQRIWINPEQPDIMLFTADQGAVVTVNGGRTWSSWYNQPTAQLYHVTTDGQFPYWVYGGQQESGAIGIASRGNGGQISFRDWTGVGADEYAYIAPDPRDPDIVYGGRVVRFDKRTGQTQNVAPEALRSGDYRILRTMPLLFHPADPSILLFATNVLWKTTSGGQEWEIVSPDLSRERPEVPASVGDFRTSELEAMPRRGVIYAVAPSALDVNIIWAGTDDGLVHLTHDGGKSWKDITPRELRAWDKVSQIDAGHFDRDTAYVAVNAIRRDDMRSHVYRTHDGGATWARIVTGLRDPVNVVREDPHQPGLLFAGTEREVYFSVDDGEQWQSLRMNMPASSVRDLVIQADDLVVGTHGRSIWILDNIAPLRELARLEGGPHLFRPPRATRVRWNMFLDTPLPPDEPTGENPPDGAIIDYYLSARASAVTLEVIGRGAIIRKYSSDDVPESIDRTSLRHPTYWIRPPQGLSTEPGHHRFVWDLRYEPPPGAERSFSISAVHARTPSSPQGPFVAPGAYDIRLTVDGSVLERTLEVRLDPRVEMTSEDVRLQTDSSLTCYDGYLELQAIREAIDARVETLDGVRRDAWMAFRGRGDPSEPDTLYGSIYESPPAEETVVGLQQKFLYMLKLLQDADARPTSQALDSVAKLRARSQLLGDRWDKLRGEN